VKRSVFWWLPSVSPHVCGSQRSVCGLSQWRVVLRKTLSFSIPSRLIPALSPTLFTRSEVGPEELTAKGAKETRSWGRWFKIGAMGRRVFSSLLLSYLIFDFRLSTFDFRLSTFDLRPSTFDLRPSTL